MIAHLSYHLHIFIAIINLPTTWMRAEHDDVIKWKHFPRYSSFVRRIHQSPVNWPHKGQWRRVLMSSLICARINGCVNNGEAGDLRRHRAHYDVIVMREHRLWKGTRIPMVNIMMTSSNGNIFRVTGPLCTKPSLDSLQLVLQVLAVIQKNILIYMSLVVKVLVGPANGTIGKTQVRIILWCPTIKMFIKACFLI